jgi:hypothetical protein
MATKKLNAENLKNTLWETLLKVQSGKMEAGQADSIASQAREILRTTTVQLKIASQANRKLPKKVINFSECSE